jgi:hypothetical protein
MNLRAALATLEADAGLKVESSGGTFTCQQGHADLHRRRG